MKQSDRETPRTDERLAELAQSGDAGSMDELIGRYKNFVKAKARGFFLLGGEPEDLVQEGMIGLFKAIRDFDPDKGGNFTGFAKVCIFRQFYTAIKLAGRAKHIPLNTYVPIGDVDDADLVGQFASPEEVVIGREEAERFSGLKLSELERNVLGDYLSGMSYGEISECRGIPQKAIDNALQRIKKKWNRELSE